MSLRCHWDGDFSTWPDYVRKVRLAFEKTRRRRRAQLGPDLVSQLSGRAWVVTQEIDYKALTQANGARYLISFLEERLARVPIPDAGSQAEALLLRLRRMPGTSMATWCAQVREQYRKLQRALKRARGDLPDLKGVGTTSLTSSRARSSPEPAAEEGTEAEEAQRAAEDEEEDEEPPPPRSPTRHSSKGGKSGKGKEDYHSPSRGSRSDPSDSEEDPENDHFWDDLDVGLPEVLPSELIGWIMLRKSSLNAAQRLNVLSSIGNSLKADDIEKGLRGAEDELRVVEKEREGRPKGHGKGKTRPQFWVEYEGEWGLMLTGECEDEDLLENDIHWLGGMSYDQVFQTSTWESSSTSRPEIEETFAADDGTCGGTWKPMASTITRMPVERSGHGQRPMFGTLFFGAPLRNRSPLWKPMRPMKRRSGLFKTAAVRPMPRMLLEASSPKASSKANHLLERKVEKEKGLVRDLHHRLRLWHLHR